MNLDSKEGNLTPDCCERNGKVFNFKEVKRLEFYGRVESN